MAKAAGAAPQGLAQGGATRAWQAMARPLPRTAGQCGRAVLGQAYALGLASPAGAAALSSLGADLTLGFCTSSGLSAASCGRWVKGRGGSVSTGGLRRGAGWAGRQAGRGCAGERMRICIGKRRRSGRAWQGAPWQPWTPPQPPGARPPARAPGEAGSGYAGTPGLQKAQGAHRRAECGGGTARGGRRQHLPSSCDPAWRTPPSPREQFHFFGAGPCPGPGSSCSAGEEGVRER